MLDLVLPERCAICDLPGDALCRECRRGLTRLVPPVCERCGAPGPWPVRRCAECSGRRLSFVAARSAVVYDERARLFVRAWKERGRRELAREAAALMSEVAQRPAGRMPRPGARRRRARLEAGRGAASHACGGARAPVGALGPRRSPANPRASAPARALARRPPPERPRQRHRAGRGARRGVRRGRRLYVWSHGGRVREGAAPGGSSPRPRDHSRAGGSLD